MRKRIISLVGAGLSALVLALLPLTSASAADPVQSITASPTNESISLAAGGNYYGTIKITNTGQTGYDFTASASPFSVSGENYDLSFAARPDLIDASKWFSFNRTQFTAGPSQEIAVPYRIEVPKDIAPGGYYAVIFSETNPPPGAQGITSHKRVGVLFYLTVTGKTLTSGKLLSYSVPIIHTSSPLTTQTRIENTGNVHFESTVSVVVSDMFGNTKAELESTNIILPKSTRKIALDWAKAPSFGFFRVAGTITYLGKTQNLPTRYTLMLSASAFVIIFLIGLGLAGYAYLTRRRRSNVVRRHHR